MTWDKCCVREDDGFEQIVAGTDGADAGQIGADMASLRADGVATGAAYFFTVKDPAATANIAACGQDRLKLAQPFDAITLGSLKPSKQRLRELLGSVRISRQQRPETTLAKGA
jgi:hypothetical protein